MIRSDAQALVAEVIAVDGALVAATLVFYAQAVARFGGRLAARIWYSPRLVLPGAGALGITIWALYEWGTPPHASRHASHWTAPVALAAVLVLGVVLVSGVFQAVIAERLPEGVFRRLSPSWFARSGDLTADRAAYFDRAYDRTDVASRVFERVFSGAPEPPPLDAGRRVWRKIRARIGWWRLRWTTPNSSPEGMITEYVLLAVRADDRERVGQLARGLRQNHRLSTDKTYGSSARIAAAITSALHGAPQASSATMERVIEIAGESAAAGSPASRHTEAVAQQLLDTARDNITRPAVVNAAINALGEIGDAGGYGSARNALQDIGQHLIEQETPPGRVGDYERRAPENSFQLLLYRLDELGGEESDDPEAHIARVCAYDVLVGAMPGRRSDSDQDFVLWHLTDLAEDLAKRGSRSAGRAAAHAGQLIEKRTPGGVGVISAEGVAETLIVGGTYALGRVDHGDARGHLAAARLFAEAIAELPDEAINRGRLEARIKQHFEDGFDLDAFEVVLNEVLGEQHA